MNKISEIGFASALVGPYFIHLALILSLPHSEKQGHPDSTDTTTEHAVGALLHNLPLLPHHVSHTYVCVHSSLGLSLPVPRCFEGLGGIEPFYSLIGLEVS
jgi:hypothetical protein